MRVADVCALSKQTKQTNVFDDAIEDVLARGVIGDDADGCLCAWCGRGVIINLSMLRHLQQL